MSNKLRRFQKTGIFIFKQTEIRYILALPPEVNELTAKKVVNYEDTGGSTALNFSSSCSNSKKPIWRSE